MVTKNFPEFAEFVGKKLRELEIFNYLGSVANLL